MTRTRFPLLVLVAVAGCAGNKGDNQAANHIPDDVSIAEAPQPAIRSETFTAAGDLAGARGQYARAANQYEQALKVRPDDAVTARKLALAYVKMNQMPEAIDAWKRYLTASKGSDDAYGSLGYAYELASRPGDAEATYKQGVAAHADGQLTHLNYGLMLVRRNDVQGAVKQLSAVLKPPEVNYNIASVYSELGRKDLAQFYYKRALECDPGFVPARQKLTMAD